MKRIVLFRFHKNPEVCLNKLQLFKKYNPTLPLYGLYGGEESDSENIQEALRNEFVDIFSIADKPHDWKWKNSDLAVREWFGKVGKNLSFDMLHVLEWDLLLCDSLDTIYKDIPDGVGLTGLVPFASVENEWSWTKKDSPMRGEWDALLSFVEKTYGYKQKPFACLGPGPCLSRDFLEKYAAMDVPELAHDELRLPLFAQIAGVKLHDTKFYKKWFYPPERKYFNCRGEEIVLTTIQEELAKSDGRRVFHPVREIVSL